MNQNGRQGTPHLKSIEKTEEKNTPILAMGNNYIARLQEQDQHDYFTIIHKYTKIFINMLANVTAHNLHTQR